MKLITSVRNSLQDIEGALFDESPEFENRGPEPRVAVTTLSGAETEKTCEAPLSVWDGDDFDEQQDSSFHVTGLQWGVYVPVSGIAYLMKHAFGGLPATDKTKAHLAFHAILNHELFHFATDYAVAQMELVFQEPWWGPAKEAFFEDYPGYCEEEEKLANAYMLKAFRTRKRSLEVRGKQEALKGFVRGQPIGYCDGLDVEKEGWDRNLTELAEGYRALSETGKANPHLGDRGGGWDWPRQFPIHPRIDWRYCPIHLVHDGERLGILEGCLDLFGHLEEIVESGDFQRKLRKLAPPIQDAWERKKSQLQAAITPGADFKKWPKGGNDVWSVRVNQNFRAHFRREPDGTWEALSIGNHKEMGHG